MLDIDFTGDRVDREDRIDRALRQARRQGGDRACLITFVRAENERELNAINAQFEVAASDCRVQLVGMVGTTAEAGFSRTAARRHRDRPRTDCCCDVFAQGNCQKRFWQ
jgi:hypothetical protein